MRRRLVFQDILALTGEVCPKFKTASPRLQLSAFPLTEPPPPEPAQTSEWARKLLGFEPSPRQTEVLDVDAKYLMLCCNRQWGKTTTIAIKVLHRALQFPRHNIVVISRCKEQAGILIENATEFAITLGHPTRRVLGHPFSLKLPNGSRICAVPHTQDTSLGRTAHVLVVDEAAMVKDEVYFSVSPFVARTHGSIWLLSTPSRQSGFFYNYWHDKSKYWQRIFSNVDDCPEIDREFLEMQRRANPIKYQQDFLCEFVQPANRLCNVDFARSIIRKKDPGQ
ncbi:MAG: terminase large subunit domain-containing protein [Bryobacteraceae bacterium]